MSGYTKLFNSILASTIWSEPNETRIVWITLLAMADRNGVIEGSVPGLAVFARLPVEDTRIALERLSRPDEDSRSKEHGGRRIEAVDGGWRILNHGKYRAKLGADERREYNRVKQAQHRKKKRQETSLTVNHNKPNNHKAEAEAEAAPEATPTPKAFSNLKEQASSEVVAAEKKGAASINSRSRRPIFTGQRFVVFDWMLEDMRRILGPENLDAFDVHEWFFTLDAEAAKQNIVIPKRDGGQWLMRRLEDEARQRGLRFAGDNQISAQSKLNVEAMHGAIARIQGKS